MGVSPRYWRSSNTVDFNCRSINLNLRFRVMSTSAGGRDATGPPPERSSMCDRRARGDTHVEDRQPAHVDLCQHGLDREHLVAELVGPAQTYDARRTQTQFDLPTLGGGHADDP